MYADICKGSTVIYAQCHIDLNIFVLLFLFYFIFLFFVCEHRQNDNILHTLFKSVLHTCLHTSADQFPICVPIRFFTFGVSSNLSLLFFTYRCVWNITCILFHVGMDSLERGILCNIFLYSFRERLRWKSRECRQKSIKLSI